MTPRTWSDKDSDQLRKLHADGKSLYACAKEMGWSRPTVSKWAKRIGLEWDRSRTAKATEAVIVDSRDRRAKLEQDLLDDVEKIRAKFFTDARVFSFGGAENIYREEILDSPPPQDLKALVQSVSTLITSSSRLAELNSSGQDLPAVDAWIEAMTNGGVQGAD